MERSHRIDHEEFWSKQSFHSFASAASTLADWQGAYNFERFSMALGGRTPAGKVPASLVVSMMTRMLPRPFGLFPAAAYLLVAAPVAASDLSPSPPFLPQPSLYVIEGYLDRVPQGTEIRDRIEISVDGRRRNLLVTRYGTPGQTGLDRYLSRVMAKPFTIRGTSENVERLIGAPPGTKIAGTFGAYTQGSPWLLIQDLTEPAPDS